MLLSKGGLFGSVYYHFCDEARDVKRGSLSVKPQKYRNILKTQGVYTPFVRRNGNRFLKPNCTQNTAHP